ncbi:MAG: hypothetical protein V4682_01815 [Patescibacteria group bacterium]
MAKKPLEGPPYTEDSDEQEVERGGQYAAILARADRHLEDPADSTPMERTELEDGASVRVAPGAKKPSEKDRRKKRTHGAKAAAPKEEPRYGVPAVTDGITETRKERHDALREALAKSQEQDDAAPQTVIPMPDQSAEEHLRDVRSRLDARKSPGEEIRVQIEAVEKLKYEKLQEFHKNRSALGRMAEQYTGEMLPKEIKMLMTTSEELRGAYLKATIGSVEERRAARGRDENKNEAVRERYQRRYEFERRMIIEPEEKAIQARMEGLGSREKKALDTLYEKYKELPAPARIVAMSGLMLAGGAAIGAGLGTGIGLTALAIGGMSAAARITSLYQKNKIVKSGLQHAAVVTGLGGLLGLAFEHAVRMGHKMSGTERKAQETLARGVKTDGDKTLNLGNLNIFSKLLADRKKAKAAKERIDLQARWARSVGSVGVGLAAGFGMSEVFNGNDVEQTSGNGDVAPENIGAGPNTAESAAPAHDAPPSAAPAAPAEAPNEAPIEVKAEPIVATIDAGEGFNKLFLDLRDSVDTKLHGMQDVSSSSPVMEYLSKTSPTELSERIGAFDPETGESMIMQPGDKLFLDDKGDLWFQKEGGEAKLLMENDAAAPGGFKVHDLADIKVPEASIPVSTQSPEARVESSPAVAATEAPLESVATTETPYVSEGSASVEHAPGPIASEPVIDRVPESSSQDAEGLIPRASLGSMPVNVDAQAPVGTLKTQSLESWTEDAIEAETHSFSNIYDVEINPSEPAGYEWKVPGSNLTYTVAFGENAAATERWALRELELRPEASVLINYTDTNPTTGAIETNVGAWVTGEDGKPEFVRELVNPQNGLRLGAANPQDFIRKLP